METLTPIPDFISRFFPHQSNRLGITNLDNHKHQIDCNDRNGVKNCSTLKHFHLRDRNCACVFGRFSVCKRTNLSKKD